eukprot:g2577.t1
MRGRGRGRRGGRQSTDKPKRARKRNTIVEESEEDEESEFIPSSSSSSEDITMTEESAPAVTSQDSTPRKKKSETSVTPKKHKTETPVSPKKHKTETPVSPKKQKTETPVLPKKQKTETPVLPKKQKTETPVLPKKQKTETPVLPKKQKLETVVTPKHKQSTLSTPLKQQLSARKRDKSKISPVTDSDGTPSAKLSAKKQRKASTTSKSPIQPITGSALDAIKKIDEELQHLPPESELEFSILQGPGFTFGKKTLSEVSMPSSVLAGLPRGHPDCFTGKTFVISGNIDSLTRDTVSDLIKSHGGRVTSAISGKTSVLIVGEDCGQTKMTKARETGVKIIDKNGLFRLINASITTGDQVAGLPAGSSSQVHKSMEVEGPMDEDYTPGTDLWVDKYKPQALDDLIGNNTVIQTLHSWLSQWTHIHLENGEPMMISGKTKAADFAKKAALLSGSPGVGKTTAAVLVAHQLGFDPIEVNASDTRNKADKFGKKGIAGKLSNQIQVLCQNTPLCTSSSPSKPLVLIMDEVDGMSSGDRGGISDLIANIKTSKIPIVCICNDKYNRKLTSLKNHCLDLSFRKPTKQQIQKRLLWICEMEGFQFSNAVVLEKLIEQAQGDIRLLLGGLQFIRARQKFITFDDITANKVGITKNQDSSPFEACSKLFSPITNNLTWTERTNLENYVNYIPRSVKAARERLKALAKAADFMSFSERINQSIRSEQKWSLMPAFVHMGSLAPSFIMSGQREVFNQGEFNFTRFTSFLGNLSSGNKQTRLMKEMVIRMSSGSQNSVDKDAAVLDYFPALSTLLTEPLKTMETEGVPEVLELMKEYCLNKDCYDYIMDVTNFKNLQMEDSLKSIPSKVKAALTRQVNSAAITCPAIPEDPSTGKVVSSDPLVDSTEETAATNPESGIIVEVIKAEDEEQEEQEIKEQPTVEQLKGSGYSVKKSTSGKTTGKRVSRGKGEKKNPTRNVKSRKK